MMSRAQIPLRSQYIFDEMGFDYGLSLGHDDVISVDCLIFRSCTEIDSERGGIAGDHLQFAGRECVVEEAVGRCPTGCGSGDELGTKWIVVAARSAGTRT